MKAWILKNIGDICIEETDIPSLREGEALVRVKASGICGSDIPRIYTTGAHNMPLIPGHEFSGTVEGVKSDSDRSWIGKRVGIYPLIPCEDCEPCKKGTHELCRHYDYLGSRRDGGFAQFAAVPVKNLIELKDGISFEEAAMLEPMSVAVHAARRVIEKQHADKGASVTICGLGTIGILLYLVLSDAGYKNIFFLGNKISQRDRIESMGISCDRFCNTREEDPVRWLRDRTGNGTDIYFECVGSNVSLLYGIDAAAPSGNVVTVGNPHGDMDIPRDTYWKILRNQLTLTGTWNSSFFTAKGGCTDWQYATDRLLTGDLNISRLISHRLDTMDLYKGFEIMRDKSEDYCKIMMINE